MRRNASIAAFRHLHRQRGNALIYVLVAIALFAALSMVLARQTDTGEVGTLTPERVEIYATGLIDYAAQAQSAVEQMLFSGETIDNLEFMQPGEANFATEPPAHIHKVYHPEGGGVLNKTIPDDVVFDDASAETTPAPGWYMGRFNNVGWSKTAGQDVILVAYKISRQVCESINEKITGSTVIPELGGKARDYLIDEDTPSHGGANADFTAADCPDPDGAGPGVGCDGRPALCVVNDDGDVYAFYTVVAAQ